MDKFCYNNNTTLREKLETMKMEEYMRDLQKMSGFKKKLGKKFDE